MSYPDAYEEFKLLNIQDMKERKRRMKLPVPKHDVQISLWRTLKSFVGKDLTKVAIPVHFNEPLTFLQRLSEDLEYSDLLDKASDESITSAMRLMYLTVFSAIPYACVSRRYSKPFNPLLAETYELVREDKGYACIAEQVSHHPPITCLHTEHELWTFWQEYKMDSKFRPTYFKVVPTGSVHVKVRHTGEHFSWMKPTTTIHNIILGQLWNDQEGTVTITNHSTGQKACLFFQPYKTTKHYTKIKGEVYDLEGNVEIQIKGDWTSHFKYKHVDSETWTDVWNLETDILEEKKKYWGFSPFSLQLNELEEGVCHTDSRCRPDQRELEHGKVDEAAEEKLRLEELQRGRRKNNKNANPQWFQEYTDPDTQDTYHTYRGGYWESKLAEDFSTSPNIF
ncbi:oxysterol-binding protein 1-like isoform X2 [Bolinopsis microptera]|uniref:oxysterol-binding protein 1-like isoform X2 n=1 Tax=Bolinopsis microptera TaxID=2820187 RepID=UPI0030790774